MTAPPQPFAPSLTALSRRFVVSMIVLAFLLFAAAASFIGYRWFTTAEPPNTVLLVEVPNLLDGGVITVKSTDIPQTYTATIGGSTGYSIPFHIEPGAYTVSITLRDREIYKTDFTLHANEMVKINLAHIDPTTTRATP